MEKMVYLPTFTIHINDKYTVRPMDPLGISRSKPVGYVPTKLVPNLHMDTDLLRRDFLCSQNISKN